MNHTETRMSQALADAGITAAAFEFDLLTSVKGITSEEFAKRLLNRWAFACDAYINNAIHSKLRDFRVDRETAGMAEWDSYQTFVAFMHEISSDEKAMLDMGLEVKSIAEQVQQLYAMRRAIHSAIASLSSGGTTYEEPDIVEFFLNPKLRSDDANTLAKAEAVSKEFATNDDGVIDVEKMEMHQRNLSAKRRIEKARSLEWDRIRGKLSAELFEFLLQQSTDVQLDHDYPFDQLDRTWQHKMVKSMLDRYVPGVLEQAISDYNISADEMTNWQIEARPLRKKLKAALEHKHFASIEV
jgi:hypothetical protein